MYWNLDRENDTLTSIVVVEVGAGWPHWLTEYQRIAPNSVVIAQSGGDGAAQFAARVIHRIDEMKARERVVRVGVVVCNGELEPDRQEARAKMCRALLASLTHHGSELVLAVNDRQEESKHALFALAGDLCEVVGDPRISVRVRFFAETGASGTMPVAGAAASLGHLDLATSRR